MFLHYSTLSFLPLSKQYYANVRWWLERKEHAEQRVWEDLLAVVLVVRKQKIRSKAEARRQ